MAVNAAKHGVEIPMDITIGTGETPFDELDFYYGAKAIEGASEIVALTAQTILTGELVKHVPSIEGIRASFRKSFVSSYGQRFVLNIYGSEQVRVLEYLGEDGFFELFSHYVGLAIGNLNKIEKKVAISWHDKYIKDDVELIERLSQPLLRLHKPIENQGYKISINRRRTNVINFNKKSLEYITSETLDPQKIIIEAVITRFNSLTGTGRLLMDREAQSISFSPSMLWKKFPAKQRKLLSKNLDGNNASEDFVPLKLEVSRITGPQGIIKHLKLHRVIIE
jgi:hypothetical protein